MKNSILLFILLITCSLTTFSQVSNNHLIHNILVLSDSVSAESVSANPVDLDVLVFGNGGLRQSATGNGESENPANGSLGVSIIKGQSEVTIGYSINSFKTEVVQNAEQFGSNLLIPDLGGQSFSMYVTRYFSNEIGVYGELLIADSKWSVDSTTTTEASPLSSKIGLIYAPFGSLINKSDNFLSFSFFAGYTNRTLLGNITNDYQLLEQTYGTTQTSYHGIELGASLLLNQTKLFVNIPFLFSETDIDGLTGGQVVIGVTISGDLLKL